MKKIILAGCILLFYYSNAQKVSIGTNMPNESAILEVFSNSGGFLPPRLTYNQRNLIANPATGLMIYCTDCDSFGQPQYYNGTIWCNMLGGAASGALPVSLQSVNICNQIWSLQNLSENRYRNGDTIPMISDALEWQNATSGAWCWYNNDSATYHQYGKLYNWYAVNDARGLAPQGWHIPTNEEWNKLAKCLDLNADTSCSICTQSSIAGGAIKESGVAHWNSPNTGANNTTGFTGFAGGNRASDGAFNYVGSYARWWSATSSAPTLAWSRYVNYNSANFIKGNNYKSLGFSVRLVRD